MLEAGFQFSVSLSLSEPLSQTPSHIQRSMLAAYRLCHFHSCHFHWNKPESLHKCDLHSLVPRLTSRLSSRRRADLSDRKQSLLGIQSAYHCEMTRCGPLHSFAVCSVEREEQQGTHRTNWTTSLAPSRALRLN